MSSDEPFRQIGHGDIWLYFHLRNQGGTERCKFACPLGRRCFAGAGDPVAL
ncbi:hypothetical protein [Flexibacterium corallicola]|uniref:hypothetical protein n=1 Tax=Flexibacterium corallicola TaxID=3037259 RepID=UPI00286F252E|nr:hypothetical protein [Pseudovibrio sp. M1P-2-3]